MGHNGTVLTIDFGPYDRVIRDFVKVVGIIRGILEAPFDLAVFGVHGDDRSRPFIVAGTEIRIIVWASIADASIDQV